MEPGDDDYARLAEWRHRLRAFQHWSEEQAEAHGLTTAQHQLLLAVRAFEDEQGPTIGDVAERLVLRHHSAVGLVDRAEAAGLVRRRPDRDRRAVRRLELTAQGASVLAELTATHLAEVERIAPAMADLWRGFEAGRAG